MSSFGGKSAPDGRDPNNRMFTVEGCPGGESPVTPRKRLHSAEDARCSSRPPPEGAGSVSISESEEKGGFCQQCQQKVTELKKQALALADQNSLKRQKGQQGDSGGLLVSLGSRYRLRFGQCCVRGAHGKNESGDCLPEVALPLPPHPPAVPFL
ncbi:hypothetical protein NQZ68_020502 [Dissostichus eleginoides]|nr:hypothetical protein NQZ68_020502 [Dissostichus eleginoides]